jgi:protein TonB
LTARQKAARSGVLAFSDALKGLREAAPELVAASAIEVGGNKAAENSNGDSLLVAGLSRGSGGIDGDIPGHGEGSGIGGFAGLPGGRGEGRGAIARAGPAGSRVGAQPGGRPQRRPSRSQEEIQEILDRNKSRMYALYNRELRIHPALQGKVVVSITIAPSGRVTECRIVYSELDAASLESKLILLIKRIDFGDKPKVPVVTTRVPIEFFPA